MEEESYFGEPKRGPSYCAIISSQGELKHIMKLLGYSKQKTRELFPEYFAKEELYGLPESDIVKA